MGTISASHISREPSRGSLHREMNPVHVMNYSSAEGQALKFICLTTFIICLAGCGAARVVKRAQAWGLGWESQPPNPCRLANHWNRPCRSAR